MAKPILISISPNTNKNDILTAIKLLFTPWRWQHGQTLLRLKSKLKKYFNLDYCFLVNSGRTGLYLALKSLDLNQNDQVLCQAFTCVAVPNAIHWIGAKPVFVDTVKNGFNLDTSDLKRKITSSTKAIIVQHNFGIPDNLKQIKKICQKHQIYLIEDCAQSLGAKLNNQLIGTFGHLTVLSFGRDKVISSVWGGAVLTNNYRLAAKIDVLTKPLVYPSRIWIFKQLLHPLLLSLAIPFYYQPHLGRLSPGKLLIYLFQQLGLISQPVSLIEKQGQKPSKIISHLPNVLAALALVQWQKLKQMNQHRQQISHYYKKSLASSIMPTITAATKSASIYLRFPILVNKPNKLIKLASQKQIMLGNWYRPVISPKGVNLKQINYQPGDCPNAEAASLKAVNLPTHPKMTLKDAARVVKLVKAHFVLNT